MVPAHEPLAVARALRHEAIDDFWRGGDAMLASAAIDAARSTERLAARLRRRRRPTGCGAGSWWRAFADTARGRNDVPTEERQRCMNEEPC
jgi:hypothetical protein